MPLEICDQSTIVQKNICFCTIWWKLNKNEINPRSNVDAIVTFNLCWLQLQFYCLLKPIFTLIGQYPSDSLHHNTFFLYISTLKVGRISLSSFTCDTLKIALHFIKRFLLIFHLSQSLKMTDKRFWQFVDMNSTKDIFTSIILKQKDLKLYWIHCVLA